MFLASSIPRCGVPSKATLPGELIWFPGLLNQMHHEVLSDIHPDARASLTRFFSSDISSRKCRRSSGSQQLMHNLAGMLVQPRTKLD